MGLGRLDIVARDLDISIDRRPFLLRPDCPPEGQPRRLFDGETETELAPAMQERARGAGLVMRRPQWSPNTLYVHEATLYAREHGLDDSFHHIAAAAYWEESADLGSLEVVKELAGKAGLDVEEWPVDWNRAITGTPFLSPTRRHAPVGLVERLPTWLAVCASSVISVSMSSNRLSGPWAGKFAAAP